jgi:hypothetical protein
MEVETDLHFLVDRKQRERERERDRDRQTDRRDKDTSSPGTFFLS